MNWPKPCFPASFLESPAGWTVYKVWHIPITTCFSLTYFTCYFSQICKFVFVHLLSRDVGWWIWQDRLRWANFWSCLGRKLLGIGCFSFLHFISILVDFSLWYHSIHQWRFSHLLLFFSLHQVCLATFESWVKSTPHSWSAASYLKCIFNFAYYSGLSPNDKHSKPGHLNSLSSQTTFGHIAVLRDQMVDFGNSSSDWN